MNRSLIDKPASLCLRLQKKNALNLLCKVISVDLSLRQCFKRNFNPLLRGLRSTCESLYLDRFVEIRGRA